MVSTHRTSLSYEEWVHKGNDLLDRLFATKTASSKVDMFTHEVCIMGYLRMHYNLVFFKNFQVLAEEAEAPMPSEWTIDLVNATVALWDDSGSEETDSDRLQFVCQLVLTFDFNPKPNPQM